MLPNTPEGILKGLSLAALLGLPDREKVNATIGIVVWSVALAFGVAALLGLARLNITKDDITNEVERLS